MKKMTVTYSSVAGGDVWRCDLCCEPCHGIRTLWVYNNERKTARTSHVCVDCVDAMERLEREDQDGR